MAESILTSTKAALGVPESHEAFDVELILHINSVLSRLTELGIGPVTGFRISDATATWEQFLPDYTQFNDVKSYMTYAVKMRFDPPEIGFVITAMKEQIEKDEYLLTNRRDNVADQSTEVVMDGGSPDTEFSTDFALDGGGP